MCTLSIVPTPAGLRLAFNRDELRTRPAALPPVPHAVGRRAALWPIDPVSGGTWIAVTSAGLALAVLNVNSRETNNVSGKPGRSRGTIIPALADATGLGDAIARARRLPLAQHAPFRLVLAEGCCVAGLRWDGSRASLTAPRRVSAPLLFTSSGLGDHIVAQPRRRRFAALVSSAADPVAGQDAFHREVWPGREHLAVCMRRPDAATVSRTLIELADPARLSYEEVLL
jgi:hypothetical protein